VGNHRLDIATDSLFDMPSERMRYLCFCFDELLIATPMCLAGTIEQAGTGTEEIVKKCLAYGLRQPEFIQEDGFTTVVWRKEASDVKEVMEDGGLYIPENVPENRNRENLIVEFYFAFCVSHFAK